MDGDSLESIFVFLAPSDLHGIRTVNRLWAACAQKAAANDGWKKVHKMALKLWPVKFIERNFDTPAEAYKALGAKDKVYVREMSNILTRVARFRGADQLNAWGPGFVYRLGIVFSAFFSKSVRATQTSNNELVVFSDVYSVCTNLLDFAKDCASANEFELTVFCYRYRAVDGKCVEYRPPHRSQIVTGWPHLVRSMLCGIKIGLKN